jgi:integrase
VSAEDARRLVDSLVGDLGRVAEVMASASFLDQREIVRGLIHEISIDAETMRGEITSYSVLVRYVLDMEAGRNVSRSSKKGPRGYAQLTNLRVRLRIIMRLLQDRGIKDIRKVTDEDATQLFLDMERGEITTSRGTPYRSTGDYVRVMKAFWNWWMKINRKEGVTVTDITEDLRVTRTQPAFVYLKKEDLDAMLPYFNRDEQILLLFLFDTIIRSPTEVLSLRASDVYTSEGQVWVNVPDEASKTFGRTFNLLYCGTALMDYIQRRRLSSDAPLFNFKPLLLNKKLKQVAEQIFGDRSSHPECDLYKNLTLYDFRHSAAIHFRILAKENPGEISLDAIRHRAGWSDFSMLNYYTRLIGLDGRIEKTGLLLKQDKHDLEQEVSQLREENSALREDIKQTSRELRETRLHVEQVLELLRRGQSSGQMRVYDVHQTP